MGCYNEELLTCLLGTYVVNTPNDEKAHKLTGVPASPAIVAENPIGAGVSMVGRVVWRANLWAARKQFLLVAPQQVNERLAKVQLKEI